MAEGKRADQQARHDLVAHAEINRRIEHLMRQSDGGGKRDDVAREKRKLHPRLALRDAVAHRGSAARDLRAAARFPSDALDDFGETLEGLMRGEHIVVGRDDRQIGSVAVADGALVGRPAGGESMGEIGAAEALARRRLGGVSGDAVEIAPASVLATARDPLGHFSNALMKIRRHSQYLSSKRRISPMLTIKQRHPATVMRDRRARQGAFATERPVPGFTRRGHDAPPLARHIHNFIWPDWPRDMARSTP